MVPALCLRTTLGEYASLGAWVCAGRYSHIWEVEGAVDVAVGAKRVLHEIKNATMERTGMFINW